MDATTGISEISGLSTTASKDKSAFSGARAGGGTAADSGSDAVVSMEGT
jgi:hypothetical protein